MVAHEAFSVVYSADATEVARLKEFGIDLQAASGQSHHKFAVPSLFVVDRAFKVLWAHADLDYKTRPRSSQILTAIDGLGLE